MKRGLLFIVVVLVAILAGPAMTPGLFSGQGVRDAWRMAAERAREIVYAPKFREALARVRGLPEEVALQAPAARELFADAVPEFQRRTRPLYTQLASIDVDDDWWFIPPEWDVVPFYPYRRHRRHHHDHHHHHPRPPVIGAVPEPATWLLMMAGFGMVGFVLRLRRGAQAIG